jgi:hypothetical protein
MKIESKVICTGCQYAKVVHANDGFSFYGCFCSPNRGKPTAEAKLNCPKQKEALYE